MTTNGWQIASTIATLAAVVVALAVAVINIVQRRSDRQRELEREDQRALAQARLVVLPDGIPHLVVNPMEGGPVGELQLEISNHSDRPVLRVVGECWSKGAALTDEPESVTERILEPGQTLMMAVPRPQGSTRVAISAWRMRWTDADGRQWCWDRYPQADPERFDGQPPTPLREQVPQLRQVQRRVLPGAGGSAVGIG